MLTKRGLKKIAKNSRKELETTAKKIYKNATRELKKMNVKMPLKVTVTR